MQTAQLIYALSGVLALTALLSVVFGITGARKAGAGLAFGMAGLFLLAFSLLFAFTFYLALQMNAMTGVLGVAESLGQVPEGAELLPKTVPLSLSVSVLEPVVILLVALGMGALARHSDAQAALAPAGGAPDDAFDGAEATTSNDEFGVADDDDGPGF